MKLLSADHGFYQKYYKWGLRSLLISMTVFVIAVGAVLYLLAHRPLPEFMAVQRDGKRLVLIPYKSPNLLPGTIIRWSSKAAVLAYTFNFVNYDEALQDARPYFTQAGWDNFRASMNGVINTVVSNQLFVSSVVSGIPVISNQGYITADRSVYAWRVQIPFLVNYTTGDGNVTKYRFYVVLTLVRVPTSDNPQGIGIDQFVMVQR